MLNSLRNRQYVKGDWFATLKGFSEHFRLQTINSDSVINYFSKSYNENLKPFFLSYITQRSLPVFEYQQFEYKGNWYLRGRWTEVVNCFKAPLRINNNINWFDESWKIIKFETAYIGIDENYMLGEYISESLDKKTIKKLMKSNISDF